MAFMTQYRKHAHFHSEPGSRIRKTYGGYYDDLGRLQLEETGEQNIYDEIQSHADSVDIKFLLKRFALGEVDVLSKVQGVYGDFSGLPNDYASMLNSVMKGKEMFNSLPVEVRAKFDHSFDVFMTAMCDGTLSEILGESPSPAEKDPLPAEKDPSPAAE